MQFIYMFSLIYYAHNLVLLCLKYYFHNDEQLVYILDCLGASYQYDEQQPFCSAHRGKKRILVHIYITSNDLYVLNELYQLSICKYVSILFLGIGKRATRKNQIISSTV